MTQSQEPRFAGKVALITGGSTGIGAAIAEQFAAEGASVALCGRRANLLREKTEEMHLAGYEVLAIPGNVVLDASHIVKTTVEHFGRLDILVNNAAIAAWLSLSDMTVAAWTHVVDTNLNAAFELVSQARPHLIRACGNVLHISSIGAVAGHFDDIAYAASKAGLEGLSRKLALELAEHDVRSNVIRPGLIMTEAIAGMPDDFFEFQVPLIPLGRIGRSEDIARAAAFLCSEDANFITGTVLTIDGGESVK